MLGSSRWSLEAASEALVERSRTSGTAGYDEIARELFAVANLLGSNLDLRRALSDSASSDDGPANVARSLFADRVRPQTLEILVDLVGRRWSSPADLADATEQLGAQAAFLAAEDAGTLDTVEDELYRVARMVTGSPALRTVLSDRWLPAERKRALTADLFGARVSGTTAELLDQVVTSPRGRRVEDALETLARLASERHGQVLAEAHVARPLTAEQVSRLSIALTAVYGRPVRVTEVLDPEVIGGVRVVVGDEVIDGSVARKLQQARQQLAG